MLVEFRVSNFRSFKDDVTFSMVASPIKEHKSGDYLFRIGDRLSVLKAAAIYGANASGKSNLFKAMAFMRDFVLHSVERRLPNYHVLQPFRLSLTGEKNPAFFEIIFYIDDAFYRYGFGVDKKRVISEWLFVRPNASRKREVCYFYRELDNFEILNKRYFKEAVDLVKKGKIRNDALLLTVAANFNGEVSSKVLKVFEDFYFLHKSFPFSLTFDEIEKNGRADVVNLLKMADLGVEDINIKVESVPLEKFPEEIRDKLTELMDKSAVMRRVEVSHKVYDEDGKPVGKVWFDLGVDESEGTKLFFEMIGGILVALRKGAVLFVDEIDSSLHPLLVKKICEMFLSKKNNPQGAQLIFTTHDVSLLRGDFLRRDQVWFVEKDSFGASQLYSLVEFKKNGRKVRKDECYEKGYLLGRYGAVPILSEPDISYG